MVKENIAQRDNHENGHNNVSYGNIQGRDDEMLKEVNNNDINEMSCP